MRWADAQIIRPVGFCILFFFTGKRAIHVVWPLFQKRSLAGTRPDGWQQRVGIARY